MGMSEGGKRSFRVPSSNSELRAQRLAPCDTRPVVTAMFPLLDGALPTYWVTSPSSVNI